MHFRFAGVNSYRKIALVWRRIGVILVRGIIDITGHYETVAAVRRRRVFQTELKLAASLLGFSLDRRMRVTVE